MKRLIHGRALYTEPDKIWIAQGMQFFAIDYNGNLLTSKSSVGSVKQKILSYFRLSRQLFRQGIHHLLPLKNHDIFLTTKRKSYILSPNGSIKYNFLGYLGNKPGHQGCCITPDGAIFFGEYTLNPQRQNDTHLYRSLDGGKSFQIVLTLDKKTARHIHFIKHDPYENCLWLGTGDENHENRLMKSQDNGNTWETVGEGNQDWRAIGVCPTKDFLVWGTDAGSVPDQNHIVRMVRKTKKIEIVDNLEGPCHGCAVLKDGRVLISTGVEGGENEKDRFARLKIVTENGIENILMIKKDIWPLILQYGVIRFPLGTENTDKLVYTLYGLAGNGECVYVE